MLIVLSKNMIGFAGSKIIVFVEGDIPAAVLDRPGMSVPAMADRARPRVEIAEVAPHILGRRHPVVKRLMERRGIEPETLCGNKCLIFGQTDVDPPLRSGREIHGTNDTADTAVRILSVEIINRTGCCGRMTNQAKIKFNPPPMSRALSWHHF